MSHSTDHPDGDFGRVLKFTEVVREEASASTPSVSVRSSRGVMHSEIREPELGDVFERTEDGLQLAVARVGKRDLRLVGVTNRWDFGGRVARGLWHLTARSTLSNWRRRVREGSWRFVAASDGKVSWLPVREIICLDWCCEDCHAPQSDVDGYFDYGGDETVCAACHVKRALAAAESGD